MKLVPKKKEKKDKINPKNLRKSYVETIEQEVIKQGVILFDETRLNVNDDYLTLPRDITDAPSKELGEYLNAFTQQKIYLRTVLGRAELLMEEAKREYHGKSNSYYEDYSKSKFSEAAKERLVSDYPEVKPLYHDYMDCKKKHDIIAMAIMNIEDAIFLLSREVTRRTGDFNDENRNHNVGMIKRG